MKQIVDKINKYMQLANIKNCRKAFLFSQDEIRVVSCYISIDLLDDDPVLAIKKFLQTLYPNYYMPIKVCREYQPLDLYDSDCIVKTDPKRPFATYYQYMLTIRSDYEKDN